MSVSAKQVRIGMIVPSLNTIAEDDFQLYAPSNVGVHIHRDRLPRIDGKVTVESLRISNQNAVQAATFLADMGPSAIAFNCTGASVAMGSSSDKELNERMNVALGIPCTNTMIAIKQALKALHIQKLVHICPFEGESTRIEQDSLREGGFELIKSIGMGFIDARQAALMSPEEIAENARQNDDPDADALLLSCANVRAMEAVEILEDQLDKPVITSNGAMLWHVLKIAGWSGTISNAGQLFRL